jgi:hypothetical protein
MVATHAGHGCQAIYIYAGVVVCFYVIHGALDAPLVAKTRQFPLHDYLFFMRAAVSTHCAVSHCD